MSKKGSGMIYPSTTIGVQISRKPSAVYAFVAALENLPTWATTFCRSIRHEGDVWVMETSLGTMSIRLAPENSLGVLDHYLTPAGGETLYVPLRVVANGSGSEVLFNPLPPPRGERRGLCGRCCPGQAGSEQIKGAAGC